MFIPQLSVQPETPERLVSETLIPIAVVAQDNEGDSMWPVPVEPPANTISLVEDILTVNNAEVVYIEPSAELITGWPVFDDMAVGIIPQQPLVYDLEHGTSYTVRIYSDLRADTGLREYYEVTVDVPPKPRLNLIAEAFRAYINAYNKVLALAPTREEIFEALTQ